MNHNLAIAGLALCAAACASLSPRSEVEARFVDFGLSSQRAGCLADELNDRLDRRDMKSVADFVGGLNAAGSPGQALDALLAIENPRAAAAIGAAGISCAFTG